ncbi:MAG: POTRA domain-containing protein [Pirellulales bacterium]
MINRTTWKSMTLAAALVVGMLTTSESALLRAQPGVGSSPDATPAFSDPNFRDRMWESGGPRLSQIDTGKMVVGVEIVGNRSVSQHKILSHMQTRQDRMYDEKQLQADIRELYRTDLFRKVTPFVREVQDGVVVRLEIVEQPIVQEVIFHGNTRLDDRQLKKHAGMEKGDPINPFSVEMAKQRLVDFYHEKGMNHADVQVKEGTSPSDRRVFFEISEGPVERIWEIRFEGNVVYSTALLKTKIKSHDARSGVTAYIMNVANVDKIREDVDHLTAYYRSFGYFQARVNYRAEYDASGTWVTVTFIIDEGPQFHIRNIAIAGNRYFTTEQLMGALTIKEGESFDLGKMSRDQRTIRSEYYGREGFVFVDVSPEPHFIADEPAKMDLIFRISEGDRYRAGPIRVHIDGDSSHTKQTVVTNRIGLREGRMIDLRELESSERRLKASQIFETNPQMGDPPRIELTPADQTDPEAVPR